VSPRRLLSISANPGLLLTRNDLLAVAGYSVASPRHPEDAALLFSKDHFNAVLIGDSVVPRLRAQIIHELRQMRPGIPIIYVYADARYASEPLADDCVDVTGTPEPLLNAIEAQLNRALPRAA